jgi:hypothetical protein
MNLKKLLIAFIAVGVVVNVYDFLVYGVLLRGTLESEPLRAVFKPMVENMVWYIIADFVAALVFVWVYARVYDSFGGGVKGGLTFGIYGGIFLTFPTAIVIYLSIAGIPYWFSWAWIAIGIVWCIIAGIVAGALYTKQAPAAA